MDRYSTRSDDIVLGLVSRSLKAASFTNFGIMLLKITLRFIEHLWFSGKIGHCHLIFRRPCLAPGSIPGECIFAANAEQFFVRGGCPSVRLLAASFLAFGQLLDSHA